jgi:hypothetical protein
MLLHLQSRIQQGWRIDIRVPMNLPEAQKSSILKAGNQPQHAGLFAKFQVILETDKVVGVGAQILLS